MALLINMLVYFQILLLAECCEFAERNYVHDNGLPLFLTPYLESGKIKEARTLARVPFTQRMGFESYAGYFTVNKTYDSNQFFWYFPAMKRNNKNAPVIVWLQGGPGSSDIYDIFVGNGPFRVENGELVKWNYTWALNHHLLYIDNPVGTGFSFTNESRGYSSNETRVGEELYSSVTQFLRMFSELQQNKLFVAGISYGGKYAPVLAYAIHKKNPNAEIKINLEGVSIGNGLCDPENQIFYGKYLNYLGLLDWNQAKIFEQHERKILNLIKQKNYKAAYESYDLLLNGDLIQGYTTFQNMTGFNMYFNYLGTEPDNHFKLFEPIIKKSFFRKGVHIGNKPFQHGRIVREYLKEDVLQSVAPLISELLNNYRFLFYNGQLDIIVAYPFTVNFLRNLNFSGAEDYKTAARNIWRVDGELAGYVKQAGKITEVMVRNAGHMVHYDQPKWALDLITKFTHDEKFTD